MCDMTHSYVWHDSLICVTWLTHTCTWLIRRASAAAVIALHDSFIRVTWLIRRALAAATLESHYSWLTHTCDITHDSIIVVTCLIRGTLAAPTLESHDSWLTHMCDMTHDSIICVTCLIRGTLAAATLESHDSFILCDVNNSSRVSSSDTWSTDCFDTYKMTHDSIICVTWLIRRALAATILELPDALRTMT